MAWDPGTQQRAQSDRADDLLSRTVSVSAAEMLTLDANPVILVPAPGAGRAVMPAFVVLRGEGGTPYDQTNGNVAVRFASQADTHYLLGSVGEMVAPFLVSCSEPLSAIATLVENDAVVFATDAPGNGELADGDFGLDITIFYRIVAV